MEQQELLKVKEIFERMTGETVRGICVQGARMKGVADQAAEHDIFIVLAKSIESYIGVSTYGIERYADITPDRGDSRRAFQHVANRVGMELGISVSFSVYDIRTMFRGLIEYNPFTTAVIEEMFRTGVHELEELKPVLHEFFSVKPFVKEYLSAAEKNISFSREDQRNQVHFRSEKRFVFALWNMYMAAAVMHGIKTPDTKIGTLFSHLSENKAAPKYRSGLNEDMEDIFVERTTRQTGTPVIQLEEADFKDALAFYDALRDNYRVIPEPRINDEDTLKLANAVLMKLLVKFNYQELAVLVEQHEEAEAA